MAFNFTCRSIGKEKIQSLIEGLLVSVSHIIKVI